MNSDCAAEIFSLTPCFNAVADGAAERKTVSNGFSSGPDLATGLKPGVNGIVPDRTNSEQSNASAPESKPAPNKPGTVVYACSGCSDAGELADRIARRLAREGAAEMSCLAGIGGRVKPLMNRAAAARILAIDGCPLNCTRHTLELAGFKNFEHLELHKLGMRKNSCPVTDERIAAGVEAAKKMLANESLKRDALKRSSGTPATEAASTLQPFNASTKNL
jgi:uncharacterized metal-binding protein